MKGWGGARAKTGIRAGPERGYTSGMSVLESIEAKVRDLSPEELEEFRRWFAEFDAAAWDQQLEMDVESGKLDALAE